MSGYVFAAVIGAYLAFYFGKKALRGARRMARENDEDKTAAAALAWYLFVQLVGAGCGFIAARWYWRSVDFSVFGAAFLVPMLIALFVFAIGWAIGVGALTVSGRKLSNLGRLVAGLAILPLMILAVTLPIQQQAARERGKQSAEEIAQYQLRMAEVESEMTKVPHAPLDSVPPMLSVRRDGGMVSVTNHDQDLMLVRLSLALQNGLRVERCQIGEEERISGNLRAYNMQVLIGPEQTRHYVTATCAPQFSAAPIEFVVWNRRTDQYVFKSDSAFLPDVPRNNP